MGRRSINTTKSGKYMNPTDQARKEARKKELKKNKKQRQIVRTAVLKGKDPMQLLSELEKIDQMEYNVLQPSPLNEKVLKDKRKKLKDTFDRVMKMYYKDDPERWSEIRRCETEYEKRRNHLLQFYEAVKHTQEVSIDEIPLPMSLGASENYISSFGTNIPMPNEYGILPIPPYNSFLPPLPGILRKKSAYSPPPSPNRIPKKNKVPPGVPPGPPPELSGEEDENFDLEFEHKKLNVIESDNESDSEIKVRTDKKKKAIRFAESNLSDSEDEKKKSKLSSGQDIDSFMKEMEEEVHKKRKSEPIKNSSANSGTKTSDASQSRGQMPSNLPPAPPLGMPPPLMFRPPPMMMGHGGPRLLGPPTGRAPALPPGPPPGLPPRMNSGMRLPPGPPPGLPSMMRYSNPGTRPSSAQGTPNVVSAAPQLISRSDDHEEPLSAKSSATIEAKAQMRNLNADVTRFLPTSIRIRRETKMKLDKKENPPQILLNRPIPNPAPVATQPQPSKDDAYSQFMREMEGLL